MTRKIVISGCFIAVSLMSCDSDNDPTNSIGACTSVQPLPAPSIEVVAVLPRFGEGVAFDRQGRLFVSDPSDNAVLLIDEITGETEIWAEVSMPNGHKVLADGTHIVLEQGEGAGIAFLDENGQLLRRITEDEQGRPFRFPNDITLDQQNGGFYFTDPGPFMGGEPSRIFYVVDEQIRTISEGEVAFSNGIVLRPDGETLLVGESLENRVLSFPVEAPGRLGEPSVFANLPSQPNPWTNGEAEPDGMALDDEGNLYVAHFGTGEVRVFNPEGCFRGSLSSGAASITNLAFGGEGFSQLYIYAANGDSLEEFAEGGRIVRLTLPGINGLPLIN